MAGEHDKVPQDQCHEAIRSHPCRQCMCSVRGSWRLSISTVQNRRRWLQVIATGTCSRQQLSIVLLRWCPVMPSSTATRTSRECKLHSGWLLLTLRHQLNTIIIIALLTKHSMIVAHYSTCYQSLVAKLTCRACMYPHTISILHFAGGPPSTSGAGSPAFPKH